MPRIVLNVWGMSSQITRYENLNHKSKHLFATLENMCYLLATLSANIQIELIRTLYFVFYSYRRQMLTSILYLWIFYADYVFMCSEEKFIQCMLHLYLWTLPCHMNLHNMMPLSMLMFILYAYVCFASTLHKSIYLGIIRFRLFFFNS